MTVVHMASDMTVVKMASEMTVVKVASEMTVVNMVSDMIVVKMASESRVFRFGRSVCHRTIKFKKLAWLFYVNLDLVSVWGWVFKGNFVVK